MNSYMVFGFVGFVGLKKVIESERVKVVFVIDHIRCKR